MSQNTKFPPSTALDKFEDDNQHLLNSIFQNNVPDLTPLEMQFPLSQRPNSNAQEIQTPSSVEDEGCDMSLSQMLPTDYLEDEGKPIDQVIDEIGREPIQLFSKLAEQWKESECYEDLCLDYLDDLVAEATTCEAKLCARKENLCANLEQLTSSLRQFTQP